MLKNKRTTKINFIFIILQKYLVLQITNDAHLLMYYCTLYIFYLNIIYIFSSKSNPNQLHLHVGNVRITYYHV